MFIKKIVMRNFKSFKTGTVHLTQGVCGIVGPNGSGKTNIIDSVLFAFGESSLKAMRVKRTKDLIFQDNNVAEVALSLETNGAEHEIKHMLRKDGKTKYLLDGKRVKKYVMEEFLARSRLSKNNVIKQGEVQRIVEMNPKDRRELIDFIANVTEYETKKKEALSELDKVDDKLKEARAVLSEREGFLEELGKEKRDAETFLDLNARLKRVNATLLSIDVEELSKEFESLVDASADSRSKLNALKTQMDAIDADVAAINATAEEVNAKIVASSQGKELELQRDISSLEAAINQAQATIIERKASLEKIETVLRDVGLNRTRAADEVDGGRARISSLKEACGELDGMLSQENEKYKRIMSASDEFSKDFQNARQAMESLQEEMNGAKERLTVVQAEAGKTSEIRRLREDQLDRLRAGTPLEDFASRKKELASQMKLAKDEVAEMDAASKALFDEERDLNERIPRLEDAILAAKQKAADINIRLRGASADALTRSLEAVIAMREKIKGIHGTVQELCSYETEYSVAVNAALGSRMNYVVVDDVKTAGKVVEYLKENKLGRISLIPLDKIQTPPSEDEKLLKKKGAVDFLINLVEFDARFKRAFQFACSNTLVMRDFDSASALINEGRLVTMEGELIEPSGLITGGKGGERINILKERADLQKHEAAVKNSTDEKRAVTDRLYALREEIRASRQERERSQLKARSAEIELQHVENEEKEFERKRHDLQKSLDELRSGISECEEQLRNYEEERSDIIRKLSDLNVKYLDAKQKVDFETEGRLGNAVKELEHKISELRIQLSAKQSELGAEEKTLSGYERQLTDYEKQERERKEEESASRTQMTEADGVIKKSRSLLAERTKEMRELSKSYGQLADEREALVRKANELGNRKGKLQFEFEKIDGTERQSELRRVEVETRLSEARARLEEFANVETLDVTDKAELLAEKSRLDENVRALGMVNLKAIELYDQRVGELNEHKQRVGQLKTEKEAIISIITEIEGRKKNTFMQAFNAVNDNFRQLFRYVFTGDGSLYLENPDNPFEGGLTFQVKLENKEVKYLELMSGGEKSLVALMFLFAIQSSNPTSVYVLDEADAALDQENSRKLALLLRQLSKQSQFIIVSHNEVVCQHADALIGVAMAGKEGSKIVQVKLNNGEPPKAVEG
ncbi:Chromosome partition protein Smc [Candidatus Norongarragalina meridionalis]|nr:Chromosome partition protein Smc [Candidatus Norongarragalina meridionalis]